MGTYTPSGCQSHCLASPELAARDHEASRPPARGYVGKRGAKRVRVQWACGLVPNQMPNMTAWQPGPVIGQVDGRRSGAKHRQRTIGIIAVAGGKRVRRAHTILATTHAWRRATLRSTPSRACLWYCFTGASPLCHVLYGRTRYVFFLGLCRDTQRPWTTWFQQRFRLRWPSAGRVRLADAAQ